MGVLGDTLLEPLDRLTGVNWPGCASWLIWPINGRLATEVSTFGGARGCFSGDTDEDMPKGSDGSANLSNNDGAGIGGTGSASAPVQRWSPINDISTCRPHVEHFTVGMNADSRGMVAIFVPSPLPFPGYCFGNESMRQCALGCW